MVVYATNMDRERRANRVLDRRASDSCTHLRRDEPRIVLTPAEKVVILPDKLRTLLLQIRALYAFSDRDHGRLRRFLRDARCSPGARATSTGSGSPAHVCRQKSSAIFGALRAFSSRNASHSSLTTTPFLPLPPPPDWASRRCRLTLIRSFD